MRYRPIVAAALLLLAAVPLRSQVAANGSCPGHRALIADLGVDDWYCDCTFQVSTGPGGRQHWFFRGEPTLHGIRAGGPSDGKLRDGDVLVAIDGLLITTREAGERLASLRPGHNVTLTIRRGGNERQVTIVPAASCPPEDAMAPVAPAIATTIAPPRAPSAMAPAPAAVTVTPVAPPARPSVDAAPMPRAVAPALDPSPPEAPRAWFGFGITCSHCEIRGDNRWRFTRYPEVYSVDPGSPAARAGLQKGDVLRAVDGLSLLKEEGVDRFDALEPGQTVRWTYRRGGQSRTAAIRAESVPGARVMQVIADEAAQRQAALALTDSMLQRLRSTTARELAVTREQREAMARVVEAELAASDARTLAARAGPADLAPSRLRYTGSLGNVDIDVRGPGSVEVTRDEGTGELVILTSDAVIRLRKKD